MECVDDKMKQIATTTFDLDQSTFSPTELDDTFMYYYHTPKSKLEPSTNDNSKIVTASQKVTSGGSDFSKIKSDSQLYLQNKQTSDPSTAQKKISKPKGTDDGFKSEIATVGSSVIRVAHQMVSGKVVNQTTKPEEECEQLLAQFDPYRRRGSKSLPASPLTSPGSSPKLKRRSNKYFTAAFTDTEKTKGSWILANLLARRDISQSTSYINEETKEELERASSTMSVDSTGSSAKPKVQVFKAKPSELREMNFWSPTSM